MTTMPDIYDHEIAQIIEVRQKLEQRASERSFNYGDFEREIKERYAEIGFTVGVNWHEYSVGGRKVEGSAMPEITVTGRTDEAFRFDPDRQVHEVTSNILELPGQSGVIKTDQGGVFKNFRAGGGHSHGHGHGHGHGHAH